LTYLTGANLKNFKIKPTPKDGVTALKDYWKSDMISGFLVFLIALPLCLGIAKASGFPPIAGIFTAIVGGIMVSGISGAPMTIKGPAAGLIVIAIGSVEELGQGDMFLGYRLTLAVLVISGVIQIAFGLLKTGKYSDFFPSSAVHGMLAAIGIIIFSKQIHIALGVRPEGKAPLELLAEIPTSIAKANPAIALIGIVSLLIMFIMPKIKNPILKKVPAPLIVLLFAVPMGIFFGLNEVHDYIFNGRVFHNTPEEFLVMLPQNIFNGITFPDFSQITSLTSLKYIIMFSLVGSIESLLSNKAIESLDPFKRKAKMNKDLLATGIGNTFVAFIGGLPMISEIVRSSANLNSGAMSRWSNFYHGIFLFLFVSLAASLIHYIPNAALAAMLMYTGYRLASPSAFHKTYQIGNDQLTIFIVTIIVTLATDLLVGITFGIITELVIYMFHGVKVKDFFKAQVSINNEEEGVSVLKVESAAIFSNFIGLKKYIETVPSHHHLVIDLTKARLVDHTFMEHLQNFETKFNAKGRELEVRGLDLHSSFSNHPLSTRKNNVDEGKIEIKLTSRQIGLRNFATENAISFIPQRIKACRKLNGFRFMNSKRIDYEENFLICNNNYGKIEISDIHLIELHGMHKDHFKMNIIYLSEQDSIIPSFILRKEGYLDKILEIAGLQDIDFHDFPEFSNRFNLKGLSEPEIRKFFKEEVIKAFETLPKGFVVEAAKNSLLIYKEGKLLNKDEVKEVYHFSVRLLEAISENRFSLSQSN
jgi:MFS superfamily sulfate permease-like transporter